MSYALLSPHDTTTGHQDLWADRTVQGELEMIEGRTLAEDIKAVLPPNSRVLEAGCGLAGWVRWLDDQGHTTTGIDFEPDVVAVVNRDDPSLDVRVGDITRLDYAHDSFDAYISLGVIEHFQEGPMVALKEAYRVLRPGGVAVVTVPRLNVFRRLITHPLRSLYFKVKGGGEFWEYRYTPRELSEFLSAAGFQIERVSIDDYRPDDPRHIGLWADFFFLRASGDYRLNTLGRGIGRLIRRFPALAAAGVLVIARKPTA